MALLDVPSARLLGAWRDAVRSGAPWASRPVSRTSRIVGLEAMKRSGISEMGALSLDACEASIRDDDPIVRSRAVETCLATGAATMSTLKAAASDPHWAVRTRLATALASADVGTSDVDEHRARQILETLSRDAHATVRRAARRGLVDEPPA